MDNDQGAQDEFDTAFAAAAAGTTPAASSTTDEQIAGDSYAATADNADAAAQGAAQDNTQAGAAQTAPAGGAPAQQPTFEQLQAEIADLRHRERSSAGRIGTFAQQADEARRRAEAAERELAQARSTAPPKKEQQQAPAGAEADDVLSQAPELRAAVERRLNAAVQPLQAALDAANARLEQLGDVAQTVNSQVQPLVTREAERELQLVQNRLDQAFGNWRDTVKSGDFQAWLNRQPGAVRTLFQDGKSFDEAAAVLKLFNTDKPAAPSGAARTAAGKPAAGAAAQERLRQAVGVRSTTVPRMAPRADDFDGAFAEATAALSARAAR